MSLRRIDSTLGTARGGLPRWIFGLLVLLGIVIAVSVLSPVATVPNGHRGVMLTFGKAATEPLNEGLHFRIPIAQTLYRMPVQVQRSETESEAASKDLQRVTTQVVLNYHVEPTRAVEVYQQLGAFENIEPRIIDPTIQEAMKAVTARFTAEQLITKRPEVSADIREAVHGRLERHGLIVDEFSITNFRFSESFDHAIEAKTVAEQQKLKAERDLERIRVEAEQRIEQARAEAESQKLNAQAQAEALKLQREAITPELIELRRVEAQLRAIEKWNGQMPNVTSGAVPFISVDPAR
jgi:prohibitin 2